MRARYLLLFGIAGGFSQVVQALLGRELLVVFYGNELSLGLFYGFWLLWIAVGSRLAGPAAGRTERPGTLLALCAASLPAAAAGAVLLLRLCRRFIDVSPTQFVPLDQLALWSLLATLPVGLLIGAAFPLICRALGREKDVSAAYIWDAIGGLAGGALFTFLLVDALSVVRTWGLLSAALGAGLLLLPRAGRAAGALWLVAGLAAALSPLGGALQKRADTLRWNSLFPRLELVETFDTPYQNISIARLGAQTSVIADGKVAASFPAGVVPAVEASLLYAQVPRARRVLLIAGAAGGLIPELLEYPVERIDCVEPDRGAYERIRKHLPQDWRRALADDRVRVRFADGRVFMREAVGERYDLIVALVGDPASAQLNRYFTREFYADAKAALAPGGVFVTKVTSASNYLGKEVKGYGASVYRTLGEVFGEVRATPGDVNYFFAARGAGVVTLDPGQLARRYMGVRMRRRKVPPQAFASILPPDRVVFVEQALTEKGGELNTDLRPVTYYLNMLLWGRFSGSEWVGALEAIRRAGVGFFLLPAVLLVLLRLGFGLTEEDAGREARFSAGLALAALGFSAMALELVLLFTYQGRFGYVYQKIGLLNGLFMAGLAAGAFLASRRGGHDPGKTLIAAAAAAAGFALLLPELLAAAKLETAYWALVFAAGALPGAGFPPAIRLYNRDLGDVGRASGSLDAADHAGGMFGALITGACLVPLFGVTSACRLAAAALVLACLPLAQYEVRRAGPARALPERLRPSFPYRRTSWLLAAAVMVVFALSALVRGRAAPPLTEFSDAELIAVTGRQQFKYERDPFPYYRVFAAGQVKDGAVFSTFPHAADIKGFAGPLNLMLSLSERGTVRGLRLLESEETPSYIEGIGDWLARFNGLDATRVLRLGREVDALSGATVTSRAVVDIVNKSARSAGKPVLGLDFARVPARSWSAGMGTIKFGVIAVFLALFFPVFLRGGEWARRIYLAAAVGVMGLAYNTLFSLIDIANLSMGRLPGGGNPAWYMLAAFIVITSLLWGQVYCGYICPFGALQELIGDLGRRLGWKDSAMSWLDRAARYMKYVLLSAALCAYWITQETAWISFNPMQHFFAFKFSQVMAVLVMVVLIGSAFYFRFWCRYFCPAGAFFSLFNKLALARRWAPERLASLCDIGVRGEYDIDCIQCRRCTFHTAYERKRKEKNTAARP